MFKRKIARQGLRAWQFGFVPVALVALSAGCFWGGAPPPTDASGRAVFDKSQIRHTQGVPYQCLKYAIDGREYNPCYPNEYVCQKSFNSLQGSGDTILSACTPTDEVSCLVYYADTRPFPECMETQTECQSRAEGIIEQKGIGNVSSCEVLTKDFGSPPR